MQTRRLGSAVFGRKGKPIIQVAKPPRFLRERAALTGELSRRAGAG
ncbi:MAG: hypothetical protein GY832_20190 [Chloroflexi bacterium]|nr:hypothetical protein [Chloroflexota bacterium]